MRTIPSLSASALVLGTVLATSGACSSSSVVAGSDAATDSAAANPDGGTSSADASTDAATLRWYRTCGSPVCPQPLADGGEEDAGTCAALGSPCTTKGETCGVPTAANCGAVQVCDDHDPKALGCPISSRKFKDDIEYLDDAALAKLHDETVRMRLATYEYKGPAADGNAKHLGFIVEDAPQSLAVDRGHDRVDMYGYLSMVVATMQVQEKEIATLRRDVEAARAACGKGAKGGNGGKK